MDITDEILLGCNSAVVQPTGNVISRKNNQELQFEQVCNLVVPPEEKKVAINISTIKKVQKECVEAKKRKCSYAEWCLGISTLLLGAFLSALMGKMPYEFSLLSVFSYTVCPVGGVGCLIFYFTGRKNENKSIVEFATRIEEYVGSFEDVEED